MFAARVRLAPVREPTLNAKEVPVQIDGAPALTSQKHNQQRVETEREAKQAPNSVLLQVGASGEPAAAKNTALFVLLPKLVKPLFEQTSLKDTIVTCISCIGTKTSPVREPTLNAKEVPVRIDGAPAPTSQKHNQQRVETEGEAKQAPNSVLLQVGASGEPPAAKNTALFALPVRAKG